MTTLEAIRFFLTDNGEFIREGFELGNYGNDALWVLIEAAQKAITSKDIKEAGYDETTRTSS